MGTRSRTEDQVKAALDAVRSETASDGEKAEMLMEMAMGLQQKPKRPEDLEAAIALYQQSLEICPSGHPEFEARVKARLGTAWMALPSADPSTLEAARDCFEAALDVLRNEGTGEEVAEAEMNLGLAYQNLAGINRARIQDAIGAYQRSLRTFDKQKHPAEFAILQNNLATAFLSIPFTDERSKMREALAVQSFEEGLSAVTLVDNPSEYAMLQNNLGNALQYVSTSHRVENGFRALEAYDEALRVRTRRATPGEYANTIANKANCLANLPDDPATPEAGNPNNIAAAISLYRDALVIFDERGEQDKVAAIAGALSELDSVAA